MKMTEFQLHRYLTGLLFFGAGAWVFGVGFWKWFGIFLTVGLWAAVSIIITASGFWLWGWVKRKIEEN